MKEKSNNSVLISRITSMCSNRQISVNKMLLESGAGTSTVDNLKTVGLFLKTVCRN